jgi:hypothetical protein
MNWFKHKTWKKIGEVVETKDFDNYLYAVMEHVKSNGDRKYKKVFMCKWFMMNRAPTLESQPEDPLKEINEILKK